MESSFCKLKQGQQHGFDFLQAQKISKNMDMMFYKFREAQKHGLNSLQS